MGAFCTGHAAVAPNELPVVKSGNMLETLTLKELYAPVHSQIDAVSARVGDFWTQALQLVHGSSMPAMQVGGKMLRPALCLLGAGVLGVSDTRRFVNLATSMELLHLAALAHDDVIDRASIRRGMHTLNARWDDHAAILAGDYLVARSIELMTPYNSASIISTAVRSIREMAEAELKCFANGSEPMTEEDVLEIARKKTASLFAAACSAPALLLDDPHGQTLYDYGIALGIAFQVVDDLLDLRQDAKVLGKPSCSDVVEGKQTLPILFMREELDSAGRARLQRMRGAEMTPENREWVLDMLVATKAAERSEAVAREYAVQAHAAAAQLPAGPHRASLTGIVDFVIARTW
ncbi:MAG TPA: polyprenyl synthetase family protein [Candidatus Hydrogenedentes bacterium]|jgi:octaprenyl-diphosphate synthase|nr:polyprenyl synthetase family protein [Candidatus Hydrogenedentota bacterium]HPK00522.1 polyprenyl synthetase family protein [Candidatus Hydrogenedentota bacterium]